MAAAPNYDAPSDIAPACALDLIHKRLVSLGDGAGDYAGELNQLVERVFGPEPASEMTDRDRPISGKLTEIEAQLDRLERMISYIGSASARLRALA